MRKIDAILIVIDWMYDAFAHNHDIKAYLNKKVDLFVGENFFQLNQIKLKTQFGEVAILEQLEPLPANKLSIRGLNFTTYTYSPEPTDYGTLMIFFENFFA